MKKIILIPAISLFIFLNAAAQVPEFIKEKFKRSHPAANVHEWNEEGENYRVVFYDAQNLQHIIIYDKQGDLYRQETELDSKQFPAAIVRHYDKTYPKEKDYKVWLIEEKDGKRSYYSPTIDRIIYFDAAGNFIKEEKKEK